MMCLMMIKTLQEYFEEYGTISEIILKVDPITGRSRGFAFLLFKENDAVDKILEASPHTIGDKVVDTKKAIPHAVHQQMKQRTKKVFVGGVPTDMPEHTIKEHFEKFGPIEEVALVTEKGAGSNKKRRGFCFVTFLSEDTAEKACCNSFHKINESDVEVKRATPREQDKRMSHGNAAPPFMGRGGRGHIMHAQSGRGGHWAPYGGHAGYFNYFPPPHYGGSYMGGAYGAYGGYGGYGGGYDPYTGGRREEVAYNSRYGPMRSNYAHNNHSHHVHGHHHPYSR
ncbi:PREDICTED: RNA-binding protein squid-like isoform X2 [Amphimedon queenslandica]|uniref:RRM domain-containing protein n=1 Tax=Amphimedon queenslandica TaxID=400682 RepID=A0AAN0JKD2_AMPQE|nr:PREDICTED: RNA-binding protein squid-like isoform X2 [Amphimedon queenslandica]|eukprot:XP_019857163.1 PREDICTED: RNA-binding protein squid-like isoform X2 [Amphimedon queenslandica]